MFEHFATWAPAAGISLLLVLLAWPVIAFCAWGWLRRKHSILSEFNPKAARLYLETFHAIYIDKKEAEARLNQLYDAQFSRLQFLPPLLLMLSLAAILLTASALSVNEWLIQHSIDGGQFPAVMVFAFLGGYMWVLYDLMLKSYSELLSPRDLNWGIFRLFISIPAGFAVSKIVPTDVELPVAFCLGALPTRSIMSLARRFVYTTLRSKGAISDIGLALLALPGVDMNVAEAMLDEGITTIQQLASWDPVRLTIRLGQPFSYVVGLIGDALLWCYLGSQELMTAFRHCGVNGAYDCRLLIYDLYESEDKTDRKDAATVVEHLAKILAVPPAGIETILWNVAYDPSTKFIFAVWGDRIGLN
jgi:hypothetical protein